MAYCLLAKQASALHLTKVDYETVLLTLEAENYLLEERDQVYRWRK